MARLKIGLIPIEGGHYWRESLDEVTRAEELGFDSVWMEEHHSVTNHYWPSPLTILAGYASRTSRMMLGTDIVVAPSIEGGFGNGGRRLHSHSEWQRSVFTANQLHV